MQKKRRTFVAAAICIALLAGCAPHRAPDVRGRWAPVNRFADSTEAIPLRPAPEFYALPVDGTLKRLLERWAKQSGRQLDYRHPDDYTLHAPVAGIRAVDLSQAVAALSSAYAGRGFDIVVDEQRIIVAGSGNSAGAESR